MWDKPRQLWRWISDLDTTVAIFIWVKWGIGVIAGFITWLDTQMSGLPVSVQILLGLAALLIVVYLIDGVVWLYGKWRFKAIVVVALTAIMIFGAAWYVGPPETIAEKPLKVIAEEPQQVEEYAYLKANTSTATYPDGRAELYLTSTFEGFLRFAVYSVTPFVAQGDRHHPEYENKDNIFGRLPNVVHGGNLLLNKTLPAGHYFVQVDTSRGRHFDQSLRLEWVKDELVQTREVLERESRDPMESTKGEGFGF